MDTSCHFLSIQADTILVYGEIDADKAGEAGVAGGAGGAYANGSGVAGFGGGAGLSGNGSGGGSAGLSGGDGDYQTQICGGLFCSGNRDGFNGGGGGAGGGGGGYNSGTQGGTGGAGGGMVSFTASGKLVMSGYILCNGGNGGDGGIGGGESTDAGYDCSTSGYNACSICSESVYDAAGGAGGAGGGGSGDGVLLMSDGELIVTGNIEAIGGAGGSAGTPNSLLGTCFDNARGGAGAGGGRIKILFNPCVSVNIAPAYNVNGGIGGTGVVTGNNGSNGTFRDDLVSLNYIALDAGAVSLIDPAFCDYGDVPPIASVSSASGGLSGSYSYQWQYSTTDSISGFVNLPGITTQSCDPGLITITTWYRRKAVSGACTQYSNVVKASVIDCSVIDENNSPIQIQVFPNPNSGDFTLSFNKIPENDAFIVVYNSFGQIVYENFELLQQKEINISLHAQPGLYFLILESGDIRTISKVAIR